MNPRILRLLAVLLLLATTVTAQLDSGNGEETNCGSSQFQSCQNAAFDWWFQCHDQGNGYSTITNYCQAGLEQKLCVCYANWCNPQYASDCGADFY